MHEKLQLGRNEMDISFEASIEASRIMVASLGPEYQPLTAVFGRPRWRCITPEPTPPFHTDSPARPDCGAAMCSSPARGRMSAATTLSSSGR